ncbi:hypothetical protein F5B18DRAFT_413736 [Nemania serpens]|nr:hypothetical protein F5B18DRAFT_413736 [Nemania serpens]
MSPGRSAAKSIAPTATHAQLDNFRPAISKCGLQILREALGLSTSTDPSPWSKSLLLSIDFEMTDNIMSGFATGEECQVGIATLDTRDLQNDPYYRLTILSKRITTFQDLTNISIKFQINFSLGNRQSLTQEKFSKPFDRSYYKTKIAESL